MTPRDKAIHDKRVLRLQKGDLYVEPEAEAKAEVPELAAVVAPVTEKAPKAKPVTEKAPKAKPVTEKAK